MDIYINEEPRELSLDEARLMVKQLEKRLSRVKESAKRLALEVANVRVCRYQPADAFNHTAWIETVLARRDVNADATCRKLVGEFPPEPWQEILVEHLGLCESLQTKLLTGGVSSLGQILLTSLAESLLLSEYELRQLAECIEKTLRPPPPAPSPPVPEVKPAKKRVRKPKAAPNQEVAACS